MLGEAGVVGEVAGAVDVAEGASVGVAEGASVGAVSLHPASPTTTTTSPTTSLTLRQ